MKNHTDILNYLADKYKLQSYLEIGVQNPANNFDKINCINKWGVDPELNIPGSVFGMTSDKYFELSEHFTAKFDLIFIDGLHHWEQVKKDFENALKRLSPGGFIMLHDCNPEKEEWTVRPRGLQKVWTGDVYKFASVVSMYMNPYLTVNIDFGCMVVRPRFSNGKYDGFNNIHPLPEITWKKFNSDRSNLLELVTVDRFKELL